MIKRPTIITIVTIAGLSLSSPVFSADPPTLNSTDTTNGSVNNGNGNGNGNGNVNDNMNDNSKSLQTTTTTPTDSSVDTTNSDKKDQNQAVTNAETRLKNLMKSNDGSDKSPGTSTTKSGSSTTNPSN